MYTNIGIDAGISSVKRAFDRYPDSDRPDKNIIDLLELSLKGNDFEFNGEKYQQVCGCAMGKRFSPNFASIYVAEWEEAAISKSSKSPLLYLRYLDDILIIWPHSKEEIWNFFEILNQQDDNIKLKATISDKSVDFLDVTIYKGTKFETSGYLDYKVFLNPQTHINFSTASRFTHTIPLKASLNHRSLDFTEIQVTNIISMRPVQFYSML